MFKTIFFVILLCFTTQASASCYVPRTAAEGLQKSGVVFQGILAGKRVYSKTEVGVVFHVEKLWKGPKSDVMLIRTNVPPARDGYPFEFNQSFIVYATEDRPGIFKTSICTRTHKTIPNEAKALDEAAR